MATFKGDVSTISLKKEDANEWGKKPTAWTGAKVFQNNDGSFNAERGSIESEARNPSGGLSGFRLGQTNVSGSFPVEIDPTNYNDILESALYSSFSKAGAAQTTANSVSYECANYNLEIKTIASGKVTSLAPAVGKAYTIRIPATGTPILFNETCILKAATSTDLSFFSSSADISVTTGSSTILITPVGSMSAGTTRTSFNAEETLTSDSTTFARFMTVGAVCSGFELDLPSDGKVVSTFSFVGSGKKASSEYSSLFDNTLANNTAAHTTPALHTASEPLVLQDGAIVAIDENGNASDTRCAWLSGSVTIENGTEPSFVGCSFDAKVMSAGKFTVNVSYEALFESEAAYVAFNNETESEMLLQLKTPDGKTLGLYLPRFKASSYTMNNSSGLVTASISGSAIIDTTLKTELVVFSSEM